MELLAALDRARAVRLMAFDVDGVLTDGTLYFNDAGEETKAFNILDGLGLKLLQQAGIELALITARTSKVVERRAAELGIRRVYQGVPDKLERFRALSTELGLELAQCGYMGDDLPDLCILTRCGFAATVKQAPEAIRARVHYVTATHGGQGAVREVCELILRAQNKLDSAVAGFL